MPQHEIWIDPVRRRQLADAVSFVEGIHHHIDPDFFLIDLADLEYWKQVLEVDEDQSVSVAVRYEETLRLQNIVSAAWEYTVREDRNISALHDEAFRDLLAWLGRLEGRLFRAPD